MATQAIRFTAPPDQTITLDVFTLDSDTAEQSGLTCTEATNRKGLYTTADFADTLAGRHYIVKKISGTAIGSDLVDMLNADATYDSEGMKGIKGAVRDGVSGRWTNLGTAADRDDISVGDIP